MTWSRRRWTVLGAALVVVAGGVAVGVSVRKSSPPPVHFWVRHGEDPPRLFRSPGGPEITGWRAGMPEDLVMCSPTVGRIERALSALGIVDARARDLWAVTVLRPEPPEGWREYLINNANAGILREAVADDDLAGDWAMDDGEGAWTLHEDGSVDSRPPEGTIDFHDAHQQGGTRRWARIDDVVVLIVTDARGASRCADQWIVSSDRRQLRHGSGATARKVR